MPWNRRWTGRKIAAITPPFANRNHQIGAPPRASERARYRGSSREPDEHRRDDDRGYEPGREHRYHDRPRGDGLAHQLEVHDHPGQAQERVAVIQGESQDDDTEGDEDWRGGGVETLWPIGRAVDLEQP